MSKAIGSYGGNSIEDLQPLGRCAVFVTGVLATWFCGCYKERKQEGMLFVTRKELSQLYWLKKEIERESRRVEELEALATGCTAGASGMPGSGGLSDKTAIAVQIADCKTLIETKRRELVTEYNRLLHYIKDVDDAYIRNILKYRYIECLTWRQVAARMGGTASAVRMAHNRFFEKM